MERGDLRSSGGLRRVQGYPDRRVRRRRIVVKIIDATDTDSVRPSTTYCGLPHCTRISRMTGRLISARSYSESQM